MTTTPEPDPHPVPPDLSGDRALVGSVLTMYREGWFPMGEDDQPAEWVQPQRRSVLPLEPGAFHVPGTLAQRVRSGRFEIRSDTAFGEVIRACAGPRTVEGERERSTWISPDVISVFEALFRAGLAHSVEAWRVPTGPGSESRRIPRLVGGLYGLCLGRGGVFCGESMFSRPELGGTDASKVCLVHLVGHLRRQRFSMIDAQIANAHTARFGFVERSAAWYHAKIKRPDAVTWGAWDSSAAVSAITELSRGGARG